MRSFGARWLCFPILKLTRNFRRCSPCKTALIIAILCFITFLFLILNVGHSQQPWSRRRSVDPRQRPRGGHHLDADPAPTSPLQTQAGLEEPSRFNVVYITLKSKSPNPANNPDTARPKPRKRARLKSAHLSQRARLRVERPAGQANLSAELEALWREGTPLELPRKSYNDGSDSHISTIRIYSQTSPYWFSAQDVKSMRFLADAKVLRLKEIFRKDTDSLLIFEGAEPLVSQTHWKTHDVCGGQCGLLHRSGDNTDVFAFHLDRVLGLNRTLPAVGRRFGFLHGGQACQVVLWDASLYPKDLGGGPPTVKITWRQYQNSLTQSCWYRNVSPKSNSGCSSICHSEWSKLALFDFLLQIHNRLDPKCCGFRPRQEDACAESNRHTTCEDQENIQLANIVHREHDLRHLVFTYNKGVFDRHEDNLDFRLLEGIKELPEQAVSVLRKRKLREKLLQSLFLDQIYWESQGGRQGIDKLIDVIEKRANVLLTYINAHKIKVIPMNE